MSLYISRSVLHGQRWCPLHGWSHSDVPQGSWVKEQWLHGTVLFLVPGLPREATLPVTPDALQCGERPITIIVDRLAVGITTTLEQMDADPGAALVSYVKYLHRIAGRIKRQQNKRASAWRHREQEATRQGFSPTRIPDLQRGLGARLDTPTRTEKRWLLLTLSTPNGGGFSGYVWRIRLR